MSNLTESKYIFEQIKNEVLRWQNTGIRVGNAGLKAVAAIEDLRTETYSHFAGRISANSTPPLNEQSAIYIFSSSGLVSWITDGAKNVNIGDILIVTYENSSYTYKWIKNSKGNVCSTIAQMNNVEPGFIYGFELDTIHPQLASQRGMFTCATVGSGNKRMQTASVIVGDKARVYVRFGYGVNYDVWRIVGNESTGDLGDYALIDWVNEYFVRKENAAFTGTMTLNGEPISTNNLNGTNYVIVYGTGTPEENAAELQAAYDAAKKMPRYLGVINYGTVATVYKGQAYRIGGPNVVLLAKSDYTGIIEDQPVGDREDITLDTAKSIRTTVVVAPGEYNFGASVAFNVNATGIDVKSLTCKKDVLINSINVSSNYVYISGINCGAGRFIVSTEYPDYIIENCTGGNYSFGGYGGTASGTFINCTAGNYSFGGYGGTASGTFNYCTGGNGSFGGYEGTASGIFNYCTGGNDSFGGYEGTASGTFIDCTGGVGSFGGYGIASGTFNNCTAGDYSFGGDGGTASGIFNYCTGGNDSFGLGGTGGSLSGKLINCKITSGTFLTPSGAGKIYNSIDGNGTLVNYPSHTSDTNNPHSVTKTQLGLGNVDNTSDLNKPISTATQTALNGKAAKTIQVTNITLTQGSWTYSSGLWRYDISNANITALKIVEVIPANESIDIVQSAFILPANESFAGYVRVYSKLQPQGNIIVTLNISE